MVRQHVRKVAAVERSGVLHPANVERFSASWIQPHADVTDVVDTYWTAEWSLPESVAIDQRIIDHPSITLSIERGAVLASYVVSSVRAKAWRRTISGSGNVFAIRLRPAGVAVLTDLDPAMLSGERALTIADERVHRVLETIAALPSAESRARRADDVIRECLRARPLTGQQRLANAAIDLLAAQPQVRPVSEIACLLRTSPRNLHRALAQTLGRGPAEVARRIRLQEVVRLLSFNYSNITAVAAALGYADQAHLTNEFRKVTDTTPGAYLAEQR